MEYPNVTIITVRDEIGQHGLYLWASVLIHQDYPYKYKRWSGAVLAVS